MTTDVTMPRLSDSMEEGTVIRWLIAVGAPVEAGQPLVEIETDKATMTYESDTSGVLLEVGAEEGEALAVGALLARIGDPAEGSAQPVGAGASASAPAQAPADARPPEAAGAPPAYVPVDASGPRVRASPVARRVAERLGVDLRPMRGTGPAGRIIKADVEKAARRNGGGSVCAPEPAPSEDGIRPTGAPAVREPGGVKGVVERIELTRLQATVSRRMAQSKATAPDFSLSLTVDMTEAVELRERLRELSDPAPTYNDMVVKAAAMALREHPRMNGAYCDGHFELHEDVNVGIAVAAEDALVVPTIRNADGRSLGEIGRCARELIGRVQDHRITPGELSGATFTVSSLGMFGIESFTPIIDPPQAAILAVGALAKRPAVDARGRVVVRDRMALTLVCDHRILYGADGARALAGIAALLERPLALAL